MKRMKDDITDPVCRPGPLINLWVGVRYPLMPPMIATPLRRLITAQIEEELHETPEN